MFSALILTFFSLRAAVRASPGVDAGYDVQKVKDQMVSLARHSWEWGTAAEALLELENPELSVFGVKPFPVPDRPSAAALDYAKQHIYLGGEYLVENDGAIGDPASLGVSALLIGKTDQRYLDAAERQTAYIFKAPRYSNGAISHRHDVAELWADFIYMAPPYLAYHGAYQNNQSLLQQAVEQCRLYREILKSDSGLWKHIVGPQSADPGLWSTGNAWAAAGMTRVLATLIKAPISSGWISEQNLLKSYIKEILDGAMEVEEDNNLLRNYLGQPTWFGEISGTALLSSVAYRMHVIDDSMFGAEYRAWADQGRTAIASHVDENGIVAPAIDPLNWGNRTPVTTGSPEGNAFTVLLYASYGDCVLCKKCW